MASKTESGRGQSKSEARPKEPQHSAASDEAEDPLVLPMRKTNPITYVAMGVGALVVVGLVVFFSGDKSKPTAAPEATAEVQPTAAQPQAPPEVAQPSLAAAPSEAVSQPPAAPTEAAAPTEPAADAAPPDPTPQKSAARTSRTPVKSAPVPAPKKPVDSSKAKKRSADLDALGADITSQLK